MKIIRKIIVSLGIYKEWGEFRYKDAKAKERGTLDGFTDGEFIYTNPLTYIYFVVHGGILLVPLIWWVTLDVYEYLKLKYKTWNIQKENGE